ncbi:MAG: DUF6531 domain-containing protein, partial [Rothia sp. (in: high G+C Gram-positive bacteria)]|nr:DUF6531 domain-containing protein [Rothia sp. (in: high G+C Gram-positive bacteria)]
MSEDNIPFDINAATALKDAFADAANTLDGQVARREAAAEKILDRFEGPYADIFKDNREISRRSISDLATSMREVRDLAAQAIQAYEEAKADQQNKFLSFVEDCKEFAGDFVDPFNWFKDGPDVPPSPSLPPASSPTLETAQHPQGKAGDVSKVSGVPEQIHEGASDIHALERMLDGDPEHLGNMYASYTEKCSWAKIDAGNIIATFSAWREQNSAEANWLDNIAQQLDLIGTMGLNGAVSAPVSALNAALGGGATYLRQPLDVSTPTIQGSEGAAGYIGDPVNAATGNFIEPEVDLGFSGIASSLSFTRMYNAGNSKAGLFGQGWSSPLDSRLILTDENATWVKADGQHIIFPRQGEGWGRGEQHALWLGIQKPLGLLESLEQQADSLLFVTDNEGRWWAYTSAGHWAGHQASDGDAVYAIYGQDGHIHRIEHSHGRYLEVEYTQNRVAYVQS